MFVTCCAAALSTAYNDDDGWSPVGLTFVYFDAEYAYKCPCTWCDDTVAKQTIQEFRSFVFDYLFNLFSINQIEQENQTKSNQECGFSAFLYSEIKVWRET